MVVPSVHSQAVLIHDVLSLPSQHAIRGDWTSEVARRSDPRSKTGFNPAAFGATGSSQRQRSAKPTAVKVFTPSVIVRAVRTVTQGRGSVQEPVGSEAGRGISCGMLIRLFSDLAGGPRGTHDSRSVGPARGADVVGRVGRAHARGGIDQVSVACSCPPEHSIPPMGPVWRSKGQPARRA